MIPIDCIDIPPGREVDQAAVEELALSIRMDGLLHPIGVRSYTEAEIAADPAKARRCELAHGRHRIAAAQLLDWEQIAVSFLDIGGRGTPQSATDAENVFRVAQTPAARMAALKRWQA